MKEEGYQVFWTHTAQLKRDIEYIATDSEEQGEKVYSTPKQKAQDLRQIPLRGRIVPELRFFNIMSYREIIYQFPVLN